MSNTNSFSLCILLSEGGTKKKRPPNSPRSQILHRSIGFSKKGRGEIRNGLGLATIPVQDVVLDNENNVEEDADVAEK